MNDARAADPATDAIKAAYDAVDYDCTAYPLSHPERLCTIARLFGVAAPDLDGARVLEVGCGDGTNLLPVADAFPRATFVGCDLAPRAIARGNALIAEAGLGNATLLDADLRDLPASLGPFDYVIAHGFYSWVPPDVRDALLHLVATRTTDNSVAFISYNTLPGSRMRQMVSDAAHWHARASTSAAETMRMTRELLKLMGQPGLTQLESDTALRGEFVVRADQPDSALYHDDLAQPNDAVHFHEFVAHLRRHGLDYVADSDVRLMSGGGLAPEVRKFVMRYDRIEREQYLDFMRLRRFRQSLVTRGTSATGFNLDGSRIGALRVTIASTLLQSMAEAERRGQPRESVLQGGSPRINAMVMWLADVAPHSVGADELASRFLAKPQASDRPIGAVLAEAYVGGVIDLHASPPDVTASVPARPRASRMARLLARTRTRIVNVRHESVNLPDEGARRLLTLLDGTRDRDALLRDLGRGFPNAAASVDAMLQAFARLALLVP